MQQEENLAPWDYKTGTDTETAASVRRREPERAKCERAVNMSLDKCTKKKLPALENQKATRDLGESSFSKTAET